ncbi:MAG: hypothetical protein AAFZ65_19600, partial [Planctomycetota bacterium]
MLAQLTLAVLAALSASRSDLVGYFESDDPLELARWASHNSLTEADAIVVARVLEESDVGGPWLLVERCLHGPLVPGAAIALRVSDSVGRLPTAPEAGARIVVPLSSLGQGQDRSFRAWFAGRWLGVIEEGSAVVAVHSTKDAGAIGSAPSEHWCDLLAGECARLHPAVRLHDWASDGSLKELVLAKGDLGGPSLFEEGHRRTLAGGMRSPAPFAQLNEIHGLRSPLGGLPDKRMLL